MRVSFPAAVRRVIPAGVLLALVPLAGAAQQSSTLHGDVLLPPLRAIDPGYVDRTANACTNFYQFVNGGWLKRDTIPAAYASSGVSRDMSDRNELVVRSVLDDTRERRASLREGSTQRKLGTFYATSMDSAAAENAGVSPIRPPLAGAGGGLDGVLPRHRIDQRSTSPSRSSSGG